MVRRVIWSPDARRSFDEAIAWLQERDDRAAQDVRAYLDAWVQRVADLKLGTPHRWEGCLTVGSPKYAKRIIYRPSGDGIEIIAFRDTRQDNGAFDFVTPRPFRPK